MSMWATVIARFLADSQLPYCHRATLRALLPHGTTRPKKSSAARTAKEGGRRWHSSNNMSKALQDSLELLEYRGLIERGNEFIKVLSHAGLRDFVESSYPLDESWEKFVSDAAKTVSAQLRDERQPRLAEFRERELRALQRLMVDARGNNWSGRGSVRLVPRGRAL